MKNPKPMDLTPEWVPLIPVLVAILQNPKATPESHDTIKGGLIRLARYADNHNRDLRMISRVYPSK